MAAARFSKEVLQMFYGSIGQEDARNLPQPLQPVPIPNHDVFLISQTDFNEWLRVWRFNVCNENETKNDLFQFANQTKPKVLDLLSSGSVKASFGLEVNFKRERPNENGEMEEEKQKH